MTLNGILDRDLKNIRQLVAEHRETFLAHDLCARGDVEFDPPKKKAKSMGEFPHCAQLTCLKTKSNIKVFTNGKVTFAGAKSILAFIEAVSRLCTVLTAIDHPCTIQQASFSMCNCSFKTKTIMRLHVLKEVAEAQGYVVDYDPDTSPGVNIQINSAIDESKCLAHIKVYKSGHIKLSSSQEHALVDIQNAYLCLMDILVDVYQRGHVKESKIIPKVNSTDGWRIEHGYSNSLTRLCCLLGDDEDTM